ncbi:MAG: hypothetical protein LUF29_06255 [Oscillospiraceae bacterium]|nr:hypothetical protein [Oscillospiraceae bacterium]
MTKKGLRIAARIVFGLLALASLIACIYYIVKGNLSEVLSSMTLCLLSISLGYIYGRNEPEPEEGIVPADEKASVMSHMGDTHEEASLLSSMKGNWIFDGEAGGESLSGGITVTDEKIVLTTGDKKLVVSEITPDSFNLKETTDGITSMELHAHRR